MLSHLHCRFKGSPPARKNPRAQPDQTKVRSSASPVPTPSQASLSQNLFYLFSLSHFTLLVSGWPAAQNPCPRGTTPRSQHNPGLAHPVPLSLSPRLTSRIDQPSCVCSLFHHRTKVQRSLSPGPGSKALLFLKPKRPSTRWNSCSNLPPRCIFNVFSFGDLLVSREHCPGPFFNLTATGCCSPP